MMDKDYLVEKAYKGLYPEREYRMIGKVRYSAKFSDYNANVRLLANRITFSLSSMWKDVSDEIVIGLLQDLMNKLWRRKERIHTSNIDLYNIFLRKAYIAAPKDRIDPFLEESFDRVNDEYFNGMMDKTNLVWGPRSKRKLGSYAYGSDTITISSILKDADQEVLDYVMYHEMLHKKHKYTSSKSGRSHHHTPAFKRDEARFKSASEIEKKLKRGVGMKKRGFLRELLEF